MKMRFDIALFSILICASSFAGTYQEVFNANKDAILSGQCLSADAVSFGIGIGVPRGSSVVQQEAAVAKARLAATVNLLCRRSASSIVWPSSLDKKHLPLLSAHVARELTLNCKVDGVETVYVSSDTNGVRTAVVATAVKGLDAVPRATLADAKRILLRPEWMKRHFSACRDALYSFYLTQKELPNSLQGTDPSAWTNAQIDTFCGIKPGGATGEESGKDVEQEEIDAAAILPQFVLPPYATANENETIGF